MRFFFLIACLLSMGLCHAGVAETAKPGCRQSVCVGYMNKHSYRPSCLLSASIEALAEPLLLKEGEVLSSLRTNFARMIESKDGVFSIVHADDNYHIKFCVNVHATNAVPESSITIGAFVNGRKAKALHLAFLPDPAHTQYPALFSGEKSFELPLKVGDKVCLKVVRISLPEGASAYIVNVRPYRTDAVLFFLHNYGRGE